MATVDIGQMSTNFFTVFGCDELECVRDCSHLDLVDLISQSSIVHDPLGVVGGEVVRDEIAHALGEHHAGRWIEGAVLL